MYKCGFCGKVVGNPGCLKIHENACNKNPDRKKCPNRKGNGGSAAGHNNKYRGLTKENCEDIRTRSERQKDSYRTGKIKHHNLGKHLSDEHRKKISEGRKRWLSEHPEWRPWRCESMYKSPPCEHLKNVLRSKGINFVEEYEPFEDHHYCVDIAFPDEKIGIEVNGNQHYNPDGTLKVRYQDRHNLFEERGWKLYELYFTECYNPDIESIDCISELFNMDIYGKDYVGRYLSRHEKSEKKKIELAKETEKNKEIRKTKDDEHRDIVRRMLYESGIDFTRSGWNKMCKEYLSSRGEMFSVKIFEIIKRYYPEFLKDESVWKRKGSVY